MSLLNFPEILCLSEAKIPIRISCIKPNGFPVVVSLWYEIIDGQILCATKSSSKIVSFLRENPKCGFEIAGDLPPYMGIRGEGSAEISTINGQRTLEILIKKYLGKKVSKLSKFLHSHSDHEVAIIIAPRKISAYDYSKRMTDAI